jgi:hypothetical protein
VDYNDKLKKSIVRKPYSMDVRMRNTQNAPEGEPVEMRPLWRLCIKGRTVLIIFMTQAD